MLFLLREIAAWLCKVFVYVCLCVRVRDTTEIANEEEEDGDGSRDPTAEWVNTNHFGYDKWHTPIPKSSSFHSQVAKMNALHTRWLNWNWIYEIWASMSKQTNEQSWCVFMGPVLEWNVNDENNSTLSQTNITLC